MWISAPQLFSETMGTRGTRFRFKALQLGKCLGQGGGKISGKMLYVHSFFIFVFYFFTFYANRAFNSSVFV